MATNEQLELELEAIVARGPETVKDGHCTECCRDYTYQGEDAITNGRCPADDCPSHWEMVGIANPEFAGHA